MQDAALPQKLTELIASSVLSTYTSLPPNGKPKQRSNGAQEWTVLAGFCLYEREPTSDWRVECIALGYVLCSLIRSVADSALTSRTGLKVLPHAKLPLHGDVLHDSHAEVIARRGLLLWLYGQLDRAFEGQESCLRSLNGKWGLRDGLRLGMYVSTLPCGSHYHLTALR